MISTNVDIDKYRYVVQYRRIDIHRYATRDPTEERAKMHDSLIAWMMSEARLASVPGNTISQVRARAMAVLGLAATIAAPTTTPDCCAA